MSNIVTNQQPRGNHEGVPPLADKAPGAERPAEQPGGSKVESPPDPFDPARLRLSQEFAASLGIKKALLTVPVRKPAQCCGAWICTDAA